MMPSESEKQRSASTSGGAGDQPPASETGNVAKAAPQRPAILIVEDDFLIAMEAESALIAAGFQISGIAATAEEAISLARAHRPAIAIMDIRLAGRRDGIDAAGDLYREVGVRCVFATAHDDQQTRERARPFSPLGWLSKPYTMMSLINQVREAIAKSSSR
ncbi:response regulator [Bradyrhizobium japonicum]|jgi:DNA-binding NarL/FixJ family response regulator|uniref:DNA-binding NarL/FixJ family response regulator n=3 Tax=Bradyrhizobium japonicum TaxID=375 RepID=A0ABV2S134_BRAJP|nr:response regulator [Bradyrhizobium japonicum]UQE02593.1 response regulator [Bradyrhizobium japonicum]